MKKYAERTLYLFSNHKKNIGMMIMYMLILMIINFVQPFIAQSIVDEGLLQMNIKHIVILSLCLSLLNLATVLLSVFKEKRRLRVYTNVRYTLEQKAFTHLLKASLASFNDTNSTSTFQSIQEDINAISGIVSGDTISIITALFSAVGGGIALFKIDWRLGLVVILFIPINYIITNVIAHENMRVVIQSLKATKLYGEWFGESINGVKEIRLFGLQKEKMNELSIRQKQIVDLNYRKGIITVFNEQFQFALIQTLTLILYIVAGLLMLEGRLTIGSIVAFQTYMIMLSGPASAIINLLFDLFAIIPSMKRYFSFLDEPEEKIQSKESSLKVKNGDITFRNVYFSYAEKNELLKNISFTINQGQKVAIVGENGAGKTTLINLILRIHNPESGVIEIDGNNINDYNIDQFRELFAVVSQNVFLFNDTIINNICLGGEVDKERLDTITRAVNLTELISERGGDYIVGTNGANLSGGQKQKIALARALILSRPILILDEATSNLDIETIEKLPLIFETILKDTTVICVTHSDSVINLFNKKFIFSNGTVIQNEEGKYYDNRSNR